MNNNLILEKFDRSEKKSIENAVEKILDEKLDKYVKKIVEKELKSYKLDKNKVNEIVADALSNLYKTLWFRRSFWINQL